MPAITVQAENLIKVYEDGTQALDRLSLTAFEGEIMGLIGPNGAGKTTAIKIMVGLLRPDSGRVVVLGHDILADPIEYKSGVGYIQRLVHSTRLG